jgi:hypothetical protein
MAKERLPDMERFHDATTKDFEWGWLPNRLIRRTLSSNPLIGASSSESIHKPPSIRSVTLFVKYYASTHQNQMAGHAVVES